MLIEMIYVNADLFLDIINFSMFINEHWLSKRKRITVLARQAKALAPCRPPATSVAFGKVDEDESTSATLSSIVAEISRKQQQVRTLRIL